MSMESAQVQISGDGLTLEQVHRVAVGSAPVALAETSRERVDRSRAVVESLVSAGRPIYGVTTGVGPLCNRLIPAERAEELQHNIVRSLAAGVGDPLPVECVRATMLARANSLLRGSSGIRWSTVQAIVDLLNHGIHPEIPEKGSVGASGDLSHLGHMSLGLMGEGRVEYRGEAIPCRDALARARLRPVTLSYKEGLALINGTGFMTGVGALVAHEAEYLTRVSELCTVFLVEVFGRTLAPFDVRIHRAKNFPGQVQAAENILRLARGSKLTRDPHELVEAVGRERSDSDVVRSSEDIQDPYSIRCVPQITGAVRDHLGFIRTVLETELNSTNDNPLISTEDREVLHGGNFLGQHVAFAMDTLSLLMSQLATLSERQFARIVDEKFNCGLPAMLIRGEAGLKCGFMPVQLVATALAANIRVRAAPASIQSIPTNTNNQDVVTMGGIAAMKNRAILADLRRVLAIELLSLCQAADLRGGAGALGEASRAAYGIIRARIPFVDEDRAMSDDIAQVASWLEARALRVEG
jgi:histidine ammonia-lyase